jgi:hypothetical protein
MKRSGPPSPRSRLPGCWSSLPGISSRDSRQPGSPIAAIFLILQAPSARILIPFLVVPAAFAAASFGNIERCPLADRPGDHPPDRRARAAPSRRLLHGADRRRSSRRRPHLGRGFSRRAATRLSRRPPARRRASGGLPHARPRDERDLLVLTAGSGRRERGRPQDLPMAGSGRSRSEDRRGRE